MSSLKRKIKHDYSKREMWGVLQETFFKAYAEIDELMTE